MRSEWHHPKYAIPELPQTAKFAEHDRADCQWEIDRDAGKDGEISEPGRHIWTM
jgi:hypothetical protein